MPGQLVPNASMPPLKRREAPPAKSGGAAATVGAEHVAKGGGEIGCHDSGGGGSGWVGKSDVFPINDGEMMCDRYIYIANS